MNIRKTVTTVAAGLAICMLAPSVHAAGLQGAYNYTLVLRDQYGYAIGYNDGGNVTDYYTFEVYNAAGEQIYTQSVSGNRTISNGCNYMLSVCTFSDVDNPAAHYAVPGEQLTLVVKSGSKEVFRSSKILPPITWQGANSAPIGVYYADPTDADGLYDQWEGDFVNPYCDAYNGDTIGGKEDDYDNDGLTNLREYQFGTDPTGGIFVDGGGFVDSPGVSITEEAGDVVKVSFNYGFNHVYSVRAIEGTETYGVDGQDLALYESLADLDAGNSSGKYFYDGDSWTSGTKTYYVKKPTNIEGSYVLGLAVDGRLLEYLTLGPQAFDITWKDDAGETIDTTNVYEGDTPSHSDPAKAAVAPYRYVFTGWTPAIEAAASNTTYTATFKKVVDMDIATGDYAAEDGDEIVGASETYKVTVPGGATVTINGVSVAGAGGGASVPDPVFDESGESVTTKFSKKAGDGNVWTITAFAEMSNESRGTDVAVSQVKVYRANSLDDLKTAEAMTEGVTLAEKTSAVKVTLEAAAPTDAEQQFFRVEFGE